MTDGLVVIGAGGFGRETLDVVEAVNAAAAEPVWNVLGVVDDSPSDKQAHRLSDRGYRLIGSLADVLASARPAQYVAAIGAPRIRAQLSAELDQVGWRAATLIHPAAVLGSRTRVGVGSVICAGAQVSTNVILGRHIHLNPGSIVGHDAVLGDFVSVNPGAIISGEVLIGNRSLIGAGSVILQGLEVGAEVVVGASACVTRAVASGSTVVGSPARAREEGIQ